MTPNTAQPVGDEPVDPAGLSDVVRVLIGELRVDGSPRVNGEDQAHVRVLAEAESLPPIVVHRATMKVVDGAHRVRAALVRGAHEIDVRFFDGEERDAFVLAVKANTAHGLPLSAADREAAVRRIMASHPEWSDRAIAAGTGLSARTVARIRSRTTAAVPHSNTRLGRDGRARPLNAAAGRERVHEVITASPDASVRELARRAGVSVGTAQDVRERVRRGDDPVPAGLRARREPPRPRRAAEAVDRVGDTRDHQVLFELLTRDPALRLKQEGRQLLRWLHQRAVWPEQRDAVLKAIPPHCATTVADLARTCAEAWRELADEVERRIGREVAEAG